MVWLLAALLYATAASVLAHRKPAAIRHPVFHLVIPAGLLGLLWRVFASLPDSADFGGALGISIATGVGLLVVALAFARYLVFLFREAVESAGNSMSGIDGMTVAKTYDRAEGMERDRRFGDALEAYAAEAARDPADAEARRRAGDACLKLDRREEALRWFREAADLVRDPEDRSTLLFRVADLEASTGDPEAARKTVERVAAAYPGTRWAEYAHERLGRMNG